MNKKKQKIKVKSDLTGKLRRIVKDKNVGVYIDAANLYYAATSMGMYVSFETVSNWFQKYCKSVDLNFYTAFDAEDEKQGKFIRELSDYSYRVIKKPVKVFDNLRKGNMDIELAVDAIIRAEKYDVFILLSGDGDFNYLLQTLERMKKETAILGVGGFTSYELHQEADNYFFLDRISGVWRGERIAKTPQKQKYYVFIDEIEENDYNPDYNYTPVQLEEVSLPGKKDMVTKKASKKADKPTESSQNTRNKQPRTTVRKKTVVSQKPKVKLKVKTKKDPKIFID